MIMKTVLILSAIILALFLGLQLYSTMSNKKIEQYPYTVVKTVDNIEIRDYESRLFTTIKLNSDKYGEVSGAGFSALAGYIFGGNKKKKKIAMTSPVAVSMDDSMTMMFMVPNELDESVLPEPNNKNIVFKKMPPQKVAAIRFGGWANSEIIAAQKSKLIATLKENGLSYKNNFFFLGYNPPYEIINRRNQIIVELDNN